MREQRFLRRARQPSRRQDRRWRSISPGTCLGSDLRPPACRPFAPRTAATRTAGPNATRLAAHPSLTHGHQAGLTLRPVSLAPVGLSARYSCVENATGHNGGVRVPGNSGAGARDPRPSVLWAAFKFNDGQLQRGRSRRIGRLSFLSASGRPFEQGPIRMFRFSVRLGISFNQYRGPLSANIGVTGCSIAGTRSRETGRSKSIPHAWMPC